MKRSIVVLVAGFLLLIGLAGVGQAEVKQVRMKIDGYLCGF